MLQSFNCLLLKDKIRKELSSKKIGRSSTVLRMNEHKVTLVTSSQIADCHACYLLVIQCKYLHAALNNID